MGTKTDPHGEMLGRSDLEPDLELKSRAEGPYYGRRWVSGQGSHIKGNRQKSNIFKMQETTDASPRHETQGIGRRPISRLGFCRRRGYLHGDALS